jgi:RNA polymerase sigma-70 factor (ECF subfamily)
MTASFIPPTADLLASILSQIATGEAMAVHSLYRLVSPALYGVALSVTCDRPSAEAVLCQSFVEISQQASEYDRSMASPVVWMSAIVRRHALACQRDAGSTSFDPHHDEFVSSDIDAAEQQLNSRGSANLVARMNLLDVGQREALKLAYFGHSSYEEIAHSLRVSRRTARSWIRQALWILKQRSDDG